MTNLILVKLLALMKVKDLRSEQNIEPLHGSQADLMHQANLAAKKNKYFSDGA